MIIDGKVVAEKVGKLTGCNRSMKDRRNSRRYYPPQDLSHVDYEATNRSGLTHFEEDFGHLLLPNEKRR